MLELSNVQKVVALSTDKAVSPVKPIWSHKTLFRPTFISANNIVGKKNKLFDVCKIWKCNG